MFSQKFHDEINKEPRLFIVSWSIVLILFAVVMLPPAFAQTELNSNDDLPIPELPRTIGEQIFDLPDSPLWGLDVALDNIALQLASTDSEKTRIGLEIAEERLLEIRVMILENKLDRANDAQQKHDEVITEIELKIRESDNSVTEDETEDELKEKTEIKIRLEEHKQKIRIISDEVTDQNESRVHNIIDEQNLRTFFDNLEGDVEELEIEVKDGETRIKAKLRDDFGTTQLQFRQLDSENESRIKIELEREDVDDEFDEIERDDDDFPEIPDCPEGTKRIGNACLVELESIDSSSPVSDIAPVSVERNIDAECSAKFPRGDLTMDLDFDDVEENGHCFPVKYLDVIRTKEVRLFDTGEDVDVTIADINFRNIEKIRDDAGRVTDVVGDVHKFGIVTDSNGIAFIELQCIVDTQWAFCQDTLGGSIGNQFSLDSMLSFFGNQ